MSLDHAWIQQVQADSLSRLEAVDRMQQQLVGLTGSAASADGFVSLEVTPAGALVGLRLDERALQHGAERLAADILALSAQATAQVAEEVKQVVAGLIPESDVEDLLAGQVPRSSRDEVDAELAVRRGETAPPSLDPSLDPQLEVPAVNAEPPADPPAIRDPLDPIEPIQPDVQPTSQPHSQPGTDGR